MQAHNLKKPVTLIFSNPYSIKMNIAELKSQGFWPLSILSNLFLKQDAQAELGRAISVK